MSVAVSGVCVGPAEREGQAVQGDWPGQVSGARAAAMGAEAGAEWSASVPTAGVQRLGSFLTCCAPGRGVSPPPSALLGQRCPLPPGSIPSSPGGSQGPPCWEDTGFQSCFCEAPESSRDSLRPCPCLGARPVGCPGSSRYCPTGIWARSGVTFGFSGAASLLLTALAWSLLCEHIIYGR